MQLKNVVQLCHEAGEEAVHLMCAANTSLPFLKDALFQFVNYVAQVEAQVKAQQEAQAAAQETPKPAEQVEPPKQEEVKAENAQS